MRLHTDHLTHQTIYRALADAGLITEGVTIDKCEAHRSRSRHHAFELRLEAEPGHDRNGKRRMSRNDGRYGAEQGFGKAATWDEWGYWIAELFRLDPDAIFGSYKGVHDFNNQTNNRFQLED